MRYEDFQERVKSISDENLLEMAQEALRTLCYTGGRSFRMTIPPSIDDTDIIFSELINRLKKYGNE